MSRSTFALLFLLVFFYPVAPCAGETVTQRFSLPNELATSTRQVRNELVALRKWFEIFSEEDREGWADFLEIDELEHQLALSVPDRAIVQRIVNKFRKNNVGLTDPRFLPMQLALKDYLKLVYLLDIPDLHEQISRNRTRITQLLSVKRNALEEAELSTLLGWMRTVKQTDPTWEQARSTYRYPNIATRVGIDFIDIFLDRERDVSESEFITGSFHHMKYGGWAHSEGKVHIDLVPNPKQATLRIQLKASSVSPTIRGSKKKVSTVTSSSSDVTVTRWLTFDLDGLHMSEPFAVAKTALKIESVKHPNRFVTKLANRVARKHHLEARADAERKARQLASKRLVEDTNEEVGLANADVQTKVLDLLRFQGTLPSGFWSRSSEKYVEALIAAADTFQLGAPTSPPPFSEETLLGMRIHESALRNFVEDYTGDKFETDWSWYNAHRTITGDEPRELRPHDRSTRWFYKITHRAPLVVSLRDGLFKIYVTAEILGRTPFEGQKEEVVRPVRTSVVYQPQIIDGSAVMVRLGDVRLEYLDDKVSSEAEIAMAEFVQKKMAVFFAEHLNFDGLTVPAGSSWEKLNQYELTDFTTENGWLKIDYR